MTVKPERTDEAYDVIAAAIEEGDYEVGGQVEIKRGRPRRGEDRVAVRGTSVRLPEATISLVEQLAALDHVTTSEVLRRAADEYVARRMGEESKLRREAARIADQSATH